MTDDDTSDESAAERVADRLRYAPDLVDYERVVEVFAASGPGGRATVASAIGASSPAVAARLADVVPLLVETMDGDPEQGAQHFLDAFARIAEGDPSTVRPVLDSIVAYLTAYNIWESRAATEAFRHVVAAYPGEIDRIDPLLDHDQRRIQDRAASVLATATEGDPTLAVDFVDDCVRIVERNALARESAVAVLANAGWLDPAALDPAAEELISIVRNGGEDRRGEARGEARDGAGGERSDDSGSDSAWDEDEGPATQSSETGSRPERDVGRVPRDARHEVPADDDRDATATRRAALDALRHLAGHDPGPVQSIVPLCVELAADDDEAVRGAAARLLVTLLLQDAATSPADFAGHATYFDRRALVEALADASVGLPGRELLFADFVDDESAFIRFEACRQIAPVEP